MILTLNATGMNHVPFAEGIYNPDDSIHLVIAIVVRGNSYTVAQLARFLRDSICGNPGFEWLKPSGALWSIDADQLRTSMPALNVIPWFRGKIVTRFEPEHGTLSGMMGSFNSGHGIAIGSNHPLTSVNFELNENIAANSNKVFYSWMSDRDNFSNRGFLQDCLEKAVKQIATDGSIGITPSLDRDTAGESGSPDIANTIFRKIDSARAFVADVTLMPSPNEIAIQSFRPSPNPNVLVELGYAAGKLGWDKCILVFNQAFGSIEQMPFDLRGRRILPYHVEKPDDRTVARTSFIPLLKIRLAEALA